MDLKIKTKFQINALILFTLIALSITEAIAFVVQYIDFQRIRASLEQRLAISEKERLNLKKELDEIKTGFLTQEELYSQIFKEKEIVDLELKDSKLILKQIKELLDQAKDEKQVLEKEVGSITKRLVSLEKESRILEGKIKNLDEINLFQDKQSKALRELRQRIKNFRRQAFLNKVKAQAELDRIKLQLGNRGFVIKDGKSTVDTQRVIKLEKIIIKGSSVQK